MGFRISVAVKRSEGDGRCSGVRVLNGVDPAGRFWVSAMAHAGSWQAEALALAFLLTEGLIRLLFEWQRRRTLRVLLGQAPAGTRITQRDGRRHSLYLMVGGGSRPPGDGDGDGAGTETKPDHADL